jgi:beta-lactamase superfamily II metal-dependent hydrolase
MSALLAAERAGTLTLRADVLIALHHGAVLEHVTADFYAAVSPQTVIVSAKAQRSKLNRLVADVLGPSANVLTTGEVGAVSVYCGRSPNLQIATFADR